LPESLTSHGVRRQGDGASLWRLTYPLVVGNLAQIALTVADGVVLGRFSTEAVAAVGLASTVVIVATMLSTGWATATQVLVARRHGSGESEGADSATDVGVAFGLAVGAVIGALVAALAGPLARLMAGEGSLATEAAGYLRIAAAGLPLAGAMAALRSGLAARGRTKVTMRAAIIVNVVNVPLDVALVYGLGWGARGAAAGTVLALAVTVAVLGRHTWRRADGGRRPIALARWRAEIPHVVRIGWPETVMLASGYFTSVLLGSIVAGLGVSELAAWAVLARVLPVLWTVIYACSTGIAVAVGQRLGAGDGDGALAVIRAGWALTGGLAGLIVVPVLVAPGLVLGAFTTDADVLGGAAAARVALFGQAPLMVATMVYTGALRAAGDTKSIMVAGTAASYLVSLPASWFLATQTRLGLPGLFLGQFGYWAVRLWLIRRRYRGGAWLASEPA